MKPEPKPLPYFLPISEGENDEMFERECQWRAAVQWLKNNVRKGRATQDGAFKISIADVLQAIDEAFIDVVEKEVKK